MSADESAAPAFVPEACEMPLWRRGFAQGASYSIPSLGFLFIPIYALRATPEVWAVSLLVFVLGSLMLGSSWIMHLKEGYRWLWLMAMLGVIVAIGIVTGGRVSPAYLVPFPAAAAATMIPWKAARVVIPAIGLTSAGIALAGGDAFAVVIALMGWVLGSSIGLGLHEQDTRRRLETAERRTAVLAVAAERERIGRDLHDILGHSLTTVAVKADLASRLIGRDDAAARGEVESLGSVARQALADVRATASGMREVRLATEVAAARSVLTAAGVEVRAPAALPDLGDGDSELLGYVVREAVTNVVRHATARTCTIEAHGRGVVVRDDGQGGAVLPARGGLAGLRERIDEAGGELIVGSSRSGTVVEARLRGREEP